MRLWESKILRLTLRPRMNVTDCAESGSSHEVISIYSGMEKCDVVAGQERMEHGDGPGERDKMETQVRVSQQRSAVGHRQCPNGRERGNTGSQGRCDRQPPEDGVAATPETKKRPHSSEKNRVN